MIKMTRKSLKVSEVWRKKLDKGISHFSISGNGKYIVVHNNDVSFIKNGSLNKLVLLNEKGDIIKEVNLDLDLHIGGLNFIREDKFCILFCKPNGKNSKVFSYYFRVYDLSLEVQSEEFLSDKLCNSKFFYSEGNWYVVVCETNGGRKVQCFKNGKKFWEKELNLEHGSNFSTNSSDSKLLHFVEQTNDFEFHSIVVMDFTGKKLFDVTFQSFNVCPSFSSEKLTVITGDDFDPEPCPMHVFDNFGKLLFTKQLRIEPRSVYISSNNMIFVALHSEYSDKVGGVIVFDEKGNVVNDVDTKSHTNKFVETKNPKTISTINRNKTLIFNQNAELIKTIAGTYTYDLCASANVILAKNELYPRQSYLPKATELILLKIS